MTVAGKVCLVTGAARGLGAEVAAQLRNGGASVVATDRHATEGVLVHDVTNESSWQTVVAQVLVEHGRVDSLVNNAGIIRVGSIEDTSVEDFRKVLDTNVVGTFLGIQHVAGALEEAGGGSIVNLSSPAGTEGTAGMSAYGSSKWAIRGLTRTAAIELAPKGIRVNAVVPGAMRTAMTNRPGWSDADYDDFYRDRVPLGRMGSPAEVAALVCWLLSDQSSYSTGADFHADGGLTA